MRRRIEAPRSEKTIIAPLPKPRIPCPRCGGKGYVSTAKLLMSQAALQRLDKLAEILPDEPVPVAMGKTKCDGCFGTGVQL